MLSIVIPVYNINCYPLVKSLLRQLDSCDIKFEIICIDDASTQSFHEHQKFNKIDVVTYIYLEKNIGRSEIRNQLLSETNFEWILFLDADTLPVKTNFIKNYLNQIKAFPKELVANGGLAYDKSALTSNNSLRFKYGNSRESIPAKKRRKSPYSSLLMSNTLLHKSVFTQVQFSSQIKEYGHEDAVFSYDLYHVNIAITHLDNPVYHTGIEENSIFINKSKIAVENLWNLYQNGLIKPEINRLLKWYFKLKFWHLNTILSFLYVRFHPVIEKSLSKKNPSLLLFDLYRLSYLCHISKK